MSIKNVFDQAQLSEAAYADFWNEDKNQLITKDDDVKTALTKQPTILGVPIGDPVFTESQAQYFIDHWKVV